MVIPSLVISVKSGDTNNGDTSSITIKSEVSPKIKPMTPPKTDKIFWREGLFFITIKLNIRNYLKTFQPVVFHSQKLVLDISSSISKCAQQRET